MIKENYSFLDLMEIVSVLRGEKGCDWDKAQTHESLLKYLIEESYEFVNAVEHESCYKQADELGDVLLQVALHSQIAKENGNYDIQKVLNLVCNKMIYRHPHVFSDVKVENVDEILTNWDELKKKEQGINQTKDILKTVPKSMPALLRAQKLLKKIDKNKKNAEFGKESIDKIEKMLDNNLKLFEEHTLSEVLLILAHYANKNEIDLEITLNKKVDEIIKYN